LDTQKLTGFVSVSAESGIATRTTAFEGLTEIPAASLAEGKPSAAFGKVLGEKFISTDPKAAATWKLTVATEVVASWIRAETAHMISITDTLVSGRTVVRY